MTFLKIRDLRGSTALLDRALEQDGRAVITNHGKPAYVMISVDEQSLEETLMELRILEGKRAIARIQAESKRKGLDNLTLDEINQEIYASRKEHR